MREYARITGLPELPAQWTFGYMQSHRTLSGPDEILSIPKTFREKKLPCDALIYLGTEFTPSGWNTRNGEFTWKPENFPDPKRMIDEMHAQHFKVVLHIVIEGRRMSGSGGRSCTPANAVPSGRTPDDRWPEDRNVACYWPYHKPLYDLGDRRLVARSGRRPRRRRRGSCVTGCTGKASQQWRPNERPFALHRNGAAGMQRYGAFLWSGDVQSRWETLKTHVPIAVNTGLSGIPYWGTDIGGFVPTAEYTGELHVRWFQFGAFCPVVPRARPALAPQAAVGLERRRRRAEGDQRLHARARGAEQPAGRADPPEVSRAALPAAALHLHRRARDAPRPGCR